MLLFRFGRVGYRTTVFILMLIVVMTAGCVSRKPTGSEPVNAAAEKDAAAVSKTPGSETDDAPHIDNLIHAIDVSPSGPNLEVHIRSKSKLTYTSIKQSFPFGIAVYLPGTGIDPHLITAGPRNDERLGSIRASYADESRTTAKVEILLKQDVPYEVRETGTDLSVVLLSKSLTPGRPYANTTSNDTTRRVERQPGNPEVPHSPALLTKVEFDTAETGRSDIRVETNRTIEYDLGWQGDSLVVTLLNTRIPIHHQRPLETKYFNSAVERITPRSTIGASGDSTIEIATREKVPYRVVQRENRLSFIFDPAPTVVPPVFDKAVKSTLVASRMDSPDGIEPGTENAVPDAPARPTAGAEPVPGKAKTAEKKQDDATSDSAIPGLAPPTYTGEKIKLDFYETDIKNVFRILKSVSGLNFAIDNDVRGKVTMSLEDPVPWDQVMDLVLKMNGLGQKREGNVVRIATMETLKREEEDLQEVIAAHKAALEQQKSLEPLVTEYIPINYSDAATEVQPHVTPLLTPNRGTISVDTRTNTVIVTDTQDTINRIEAMIFRLDTVTPQIMIEAKVVEVTKDFSRSIGIGWTLSNASAVTSAFVDDFNVAVNEPSGEPSLGEFSFFRLFGSSVTALNAKLEASEEKGDVRIVSSPRILTLDNKKAKIKQGVEYAYLERDDSGGSSVSFKDIDLLLEVTPHVTPDKRISMNIFITKNDISGVTSTGAPTLATNEAETELLVNNNDTVVIGGIVKTTKNDDRTGLPFLSGIPILGQLFGTTSKVDNRSELLIFLTPSIVQLKQKRNIHTPPVN